MNYHSTKSFWDSIGYSKVNGFLTRHSGHKIGPVPIYNILEEDYEDCDKDELIECMISDGCKIVRKVYLDGTYDYFVLSK